MRLSTFLPLLATASTSLAASWPYAPFNNSGRWIVNTQHKNVTYAGVNWPGAADAMIPEGLQYQNISFIVSKIKSLGMNVIRLTYAIEMIDDILDRGGDVTLQDAFVKALGSVNGTKVLAQVLAKNKRFTAETTRLQVLDAVAAECARQKIYVHLDNHMSKGGWCCKAYDGNGWFGDVYFDVVKWKRGLQYMAQHAAKWPAFVSMSLRNELRHPLASPDLDKSSYGWKDWYPNMVAAATAIHAVNKDVLIFFSGLNYDFDMSPIPLAADLGNNQRFRKTDFAFANKIVLEVHNYGSPTNCTQFQNQLINAGFNALDAGNKTIVNVLPVLLTEWGHDQGTTGMNSVYATCLRQFLPARKAGWMYWVLAGSYYIQLGAQDADDHFGLLNHDWSAWRFPPNIENAMIPMVKKTLA